MIGFLRGKKTYIVGTGWILWGLWSYLVEGNAVDGMQRIMEGVGFITLRAGVSKTTAPAN